MKKKWNHECCTIRYLTFGIIIIIGNRSNCSLLDNMLNFGWFFSLFKMSMVFWTTTPQKYNHPHLWSCSFGTEKWLHGYTWQEVCAGRRRKRVISPSAPSDLLWTDSARTHWPQHDCCHWGNDYRHTGLLTRALTAIYQTGFTFSVKFE